jgi:hypothetical protein
MRRSLALAFVLVGLALTWPACGTGPSHGVNFGTLTGSQTFNIGDVGSFTFIVTNVDGTRQDVSTKTTWTSSDPSILAIDKSGQATARAAGVVTISASYNGIQRSLTVAVSTSIGAVQLLGKVTASGAPLAGAQVTATFGTVTLTTRTAFDGVFRLFPVGGTGQLTITFAGFTTLTQSVAVPVSGTVPFVMTPLVTPADISGAWQLTMTAPASCAAALPSDARQMSAATTITQQGTAITVELVSDALPNNPYDLPGQVIDHAVTINLLSDFYYGPVEGVLLRQLGPTRWLLVFGNMVGTVGARSITGTTSGTWDYFETASAADVPLMPPKATCTDSAPTSLQRATSTGAKDR